MSEKRIKLWLPELKQGLRVTGTRASTGSTVSASGVVQETKVCSTSFLLHSENSLTEPEVTILALDTPKSSGAIEGFDCVSTPSCPTLGAAGAQDDCPGPSTTRERRKLTFQKPAYCDNSTDRLEDG